VLSTIHAVSHGQPDEPVGAGHLTAVIMANKLAKETPIGSSGYHSDTPVIPLLQQLTTLTDRALNQPHVPAPIKTALEKQAEDLKKEIDPYMQDGDWAKVDLQRGLKHSTNMACLDFVADLAKRGSSAG
jgi:hypothetical protein